jgi:hypothetical protein
MVLNNLAGGVTAGAIARGKRIEIPVLRFGEMKSLRRRDIYDDVYDDAL